MIYNDTAATVVSGIIHIHEKLGNDPGMYYRMVADYPILPSSSGYLTANVLANVSSQAVFFNDVRYDFTEFQGIPAGK